MSGVQWTTSQMPLERYSLKEALDMMIAPQIDGCNDSLFVSFAFGGI